MRPDSFDPVNYDEDQKARDMAVLEHEFVHTQNPLMLDGEPYFGIALEERRAEYFSDDKMGYLDVKQLMIDLETVTGFNIKSWFEKHKNSDRVEAYIDLANSLGTQAALEIALTVPQRYQNDSKSLQKMVSEYLGPPDELLKRFYGQALANGQETDIDARVEATVRRWMDRGVNIELLGDIRPGDVGLSFMTEKYLKKYHEISAPPGEH